jgi:hypothetical protein
MALTSSQRRACDAFGELSIRKRKEMHALGQALRSCAQTYPLAQQWIATWGRSAIRSAEERALLRDIHTLASNGNPDALAVVESTILHLATRRITS